MREALPLHVNDRAKPTPPMHPNPEELARPGAEAAGPGAAVPSGEPDGASHPASERSGRANAVGQLAGGVAHDFNNILASMHLQLGLLEGLPDLPPTVKAAIGQLRDDANRAATLTRQLLTYGGGQVMQLTTLELGHQVERLARALEPVVNRKTRLLVRRGPSVWIQADAVMIDQMITTMVLNARDAIGDRPGTISLEVTRRSVNGADQRARAREGEFACLSIRDSGTGISEAARAHLFEPFFTTKPVGEGKGLGLATAYAIAEQHHGWIDVESRRDEGTLFTIFLPLAVGPATVIAEPNHAAPQSSGGTILLVEDDPSVRKLTRVALERSGYRVLEAADGPAALAVWQENRDAIDALFTDMVMPKGMTGWDLAQTIRSERPGVGVILTSGYSIDLKRAGVPAGIDFISKPFPLIRLVTLIRTVIDRGRASG